MNLFRFVAACKAAGQGTAGWVSGSSPDGGKNFRFAHQTVFKALEEF
jgi:hypothetical protein